MRRVLLLLVVSLVGAVGVTAQPAGAVASDDKQFISADNTFYAYVKGGETIGASFLRAAKNEIFATVRGDVTITLDGPEFAQQTCVAKKDVTVGDGCRFAPVTATKTGIWRMQFIAPEGAKSYPEVSPVVKWGGNFFRWNITVKGSAGEEKGRVWTERYALRQPAGDEFVDDLVNYYISEDGYIYKATEFGYNGQISTLSADSVGIRSGKDCVSAYRSTDVSDLEHSPALGACGSGYKLFFEEPAGVLPPKATKWDGSSDWVRPDIKRPSVSELHFESDNSNDQQSGTISFFLRNFIGQYQIKIDVDGDSKTARGEGTQAPDDTSGFDGQNDVTINLQMKKLSNGLQRVHFGGVDRTGQIIPTSQKIAVKVVIARVAEIHLVAADVEARTGGLELVRLNGDNAPTSRICWNDTELVELADVSLNTKEPDGRKCPDSMKGIHSWVNSDGSWGNARYIDDWVYASAKLDGNNQIAYPSAQAAETETAKKNWTLLVFVGGLLALGIIAAVVVVILRRKRNKETSAAPAVSQPGIVPSPGNDRQDPPTYPPQAPLS